MNDTASVIRCLRCGTRLRQRRACPSCGLDVPKDRSAVMPGDVGGEAYANIGAKAPRRAEAKKGKAICPVCLSTVPTEDMADHGGQMICGDCHQKMAKKAGRAPPPEQPAG